MVASESSARHTPPIVWCAACSATDRGSPEGDQVPMSGPYPPSGYPRPSDQGGWGDQPQQPHYDFPTVQYGGLTNPQGGWGPPPPRRNRGRVIVAAVSILVIIGGVATGALLLQQRHAQ